MKSKTLYVGTSLKSSRKLGNTTDNTGDAMKLARSLYENGVGGKLVEFVNIYNNKGKVISGYGMVNGSVGWYDAKRKPMKVEDQVEAIVDDENSPTGKVEVAEALPQVDMAPIVEGQEQQAVVEGQATCAAEGCAGCGSAEATHASFSIVPQVANDRFDDVPLSGAFAIENDERFYVKVGKTSAIAYGPTGVEKIRFPKNQRVANRSIEVAISLN